MVVGVFAQDRHALAATESFRHQAFVEVVIQCACGAVTTVTDVGCAPCLVKCAPLNVVLVSFFRCVAGIVFARSQVVGVPATRYYKVLARVGKCADIVVDYAVEYPHALCGVVVGVTVVPLAPHTEAADFHRFHHRVIFVVLIQSVEELAQTFLVDRIRHIGYTCRGYCSAIGITNHLVTDVVLVKQVLRCGIVGVRPHATVGGYT